MSTVTTTSNIERSPFFVAKNAQSKNQAANPAAAAFAALLMSAEEAEAPVETSASLAKDHRTTTDNEQDADDLASTDAGQLALTGLLNWQALAASDSAPKATATSSQPGSGTAPNALLDLPLTSKGLQELGELQPIPGLVTDLNAGMTPVDSKGLPEPLKAASIASVTLRPDLSALTGKEAASAVSLISLNPTEAAGLPGVNPVAVGSVQATRDAFGQVASKSGAAKSRGGITRNQLGSTEVAATAVATPTTPGAVPTGQTPKAEWLPRTTVDLALKQGWQGGADANEDTSSASEILAVPAKPEGARGNSDTGAQTGEHLLAGDHPPPESAATDPSAASGMVPDNFAEMLDNLGGQIAYWATQGRQQASMTLGDDKNNPMDVNISMRDGEVHVAFEAAEGEVRDALALSIEDMLRNMLESKGMTLGEVTIGQRQSSGNAGESMHGNGQGNHQTGASSRTPGGEATSSNVPPPPSPRRPDIATRTKVDLFA